MRKKIKLTSDIPNKWNTFPDRAHILVGYD